MVAVRDEENAIPRFYERMRSVLDDVGLEWEIVFVEDSSTDNTVSILRKLGEEDQRVKALFLTRGFGHHAAITAGLDSVTGDHIVLMDGDLQHRPEDIPRLLQSYFAGYEIVYGKRSSRPPFIKHVGSVGINYVANRLSDYPIDLNSGMFRVFSRRVNQELSAMEERSRFLQGMMSWLGFPSSKVPIEEDPRTTGNTKYGLKEMAELAITYILSFSTRPLRMATYFGLLIAFISVVSAAFYLIQALAVGVPVSGFPTLVITLSGIGGTILFSLGIIGEYLGKLYMEVQGRPLYVVAEAMNLKEPADKGGAAEETQRKNLRSLRA